MRAWFAIALLAGSWLLGLGYFQAASQFAWLCFVGLAVVLLADVPLRFPAGPASLAALGLLFPAILVAPSIYKAAPFLLALGILLHRLPIPRRWPRRVGRGAACAGGILLVQAMAIWLYQLGTARAHELPWPLIELPHLLAKLLGTDAALDGASVAVRNCLATHRFAATWEFLFDPASVAFFVGGLTAVVHAAGCRGGPAGARQCMRDAIRLLATTILWALLRAALLFALVIHQTLRADSVTYPNVGQLLVSTWLHLALLGGLAVFTGCLVPWPAGRRIVPKGESNIPMRQQILALAMIGAAVGVLTGLYFWAAVGERRQGRIMIVERHSTWEPTTEPYRTSVYGEAGSYNYAAAYEYCDQYYDMSRLLETDSIDEPSLAACDVLIIKTPTARYSPDEVDAVVQYVQRGGSLLLIGDHTNVFNMNTYLNDVARHFGFTFRNDLLFRIGDPYRQEYRPPRVAHPILQDVPPMNFAVSCSIDPGRSVGTMVIRSTGLWNLPPAYHESNYHPQAEYQPNMQYGAWCQLWATTYGRGRVVAFGDSTLFSNFCVFQPGKTELLIGMLEWLNHTSSLDQKTLRIVLWFPAILAGLACLAMGIRMVRPSRAAWMPVAAAGWAGWSVACIAIIGIHRWSMPEPVVHQAMPHVVMDRTLSNVPLFTGAFADDKDGAGYGMFEQWIPCIGNSLSRRSGTDVFGGDGLVITCPTRPASAEYCDRLVQFVQNGGRVLVVDALSAENSTANSVIRPFGLASDHVVQEQTDQYLRLANDTTPIALPAACEISGGTPLAWLGEVPVAAQVRLGQGTVTVIGFGDLLNDANMGMHWLPDPDAETRQVYDVLYRLLRASLPGEPQPEP